MHQLVDLKRLADEVPRAAFDGFDGILDRPVAGDDDGDDVGVAPDGRLDDGAAVDPRQAQVRDEDVEGKICQSREGGLARICLLDLEAAIGELLGDGLPEGGLVFDEEQMFRLVSHLQQPPIF